MLTFKSFTGINNVLPPERLSAKELQSATDVDIDRSGALLRRAGYAELSGTCHKNIWQAAGFMLSTISGNDLVALAGATQTLVQAALGPARVWYVNLPDGRTAFSNGAICGITGGGSATSWGVPRPPVAGALTPVSGNLHASTYRISITYVRSADGAESGPTYIVEDTFAGGLLLTGLPAAAGMTINVYADGYLAGNTAGAMFTFSGANHELVSACRTEHFDPAPAGRCLAFWRGRCLVAKDNVLYASRPHEWEHFDMRRDFKQFSAPITAVIPVEGGVFVGTEAEFAFLAGTEFDKLEFRPQVAAPTVLGSGIAVPGDALEPRDGGAPGPGGIAIVGGMLTACYSNGLAVRLSEGQYVTTATEVAATFRYVQGTPQYLAIPQ